MKRVIFIFVIVVSTFAQKAVPLKDLIPENNVTMDIIQSTYPPRAMELYMIFHSSIQMYPQWFMQYMTEHQDIQSGEKLPYHERFGLTEVQYTEMVSLMDSLTFVKISSETVEVEKRRRKHKITGGTNLYKLKDIQIDRGKGILTTPLGICSTYTTVIDREGQIGTWSGYSWKLEKGDPFATGEATFITFNIGFIEENQKRFIYYRAKEVKQGILKENIDFIVFY